jgi:hypothetical protein
LSATITPSSSSSKVLVVVSTAFVASTGGQTASIELTRAGTPIGGGTSSGSRPSGFKSFYQGSQFSGNTLAGEFLDSPSSTSSLTYQVKAKTNTGTITLGVTGGDGDNVANSRTSSTITLIEVAG